MASVVDVSAILQNAQSADAHARQQAEIQLQQFQQQDYPSYLLSLATELSKEQADAATRQMAGVILKNNVDAPSEARKVRRVLGDYQPVPRLPSILQGAEAHASVSTYTGRTCGALERIATAVKAQIRQLLLSTLASEVWIDHPSATFVYSVSAHDEGVLTLYN